MTKGMERVKERRKELDISPDQLAARIGVSRATFYRYEGGQTKLPTALLEPLAEALLTTPQELMGWSDEATTPAQKGRAAEDIPAGFEPLPPQIRVPLVGRIACGTPLLAEQNVEGEVNAPCTRQVDFALTCVGDSMIEAGILDGDIVYIRRQPKVEDGEIAAVRIGDEATLKRVYYDGESLTLIPCNREYRPRTYAGAELADIHIEGLAVGWMHWA